jgi:hypothetical protein
MPAKAPPISPKRFDFDLGRLEKEGVGSTVQVAEAFRPSFSMKPSFNHIIPYCDANISMAM